MFLSDLKPLFEKFNSINNIYINIVAFNIKSKREAIDITEQCESTLDNYMTDSDLKFTIDKYSQLKDLFELLRFYIRHSNFEADKVIKDIKLMCINKRIIKKEILLRRIRNKSQIGTLDELPNHIIDSIYEKIIA